MKRGEQQKAEEEKEKSSRSRQKLVRGGAFGDGGEKSLVDSRNSGLVLLRIARFI